jgi:hypothetical protein
VDLITKMMATYDEKFKPINIFGLIISTIGIVGLAMAPAIFVGNGFSQPIWFIVFSSLQVLLFLIGGVGIVMRKSWTYYIMKMILYWLLIAFPVGTLISVKMLRYVKKNNIKDFFCA